VVVPANKLSEDSPPSLAKGPLLRSGPPGRRTNWPTWQVPSSHAARAICSCELPSLRRLTKTEEELTTDTPTERVQNDFQPEAQT